MSSHKAVAVSNTLAEQCSFVSISTGISLYIPII